MRTASDYMRARERVLTYPLGMDDPNLPSDLDGVARSMRAYRDAQHEPPSPDQVAAVARLLSMRRHPSGRRREPVNGESH